MRMRDSQTSIRRVRFAAAMRYNADRPPVILAVCTTPCPRWGPVTLSRSPYSAQGDVSRNSPRAVSSLCAVRFGRTRCGDHENRSYAKTSPSGLRLPFSTS